MLRTAVLRTAVLRTAVLRTAVLRTAIAPPVWRGELSSHLEVATDRGGGATHPVAVESERRDPDARRTHDGM